MIERVYKYTKREYAEALLNRGEIKIGTLYDFRDKETHGNRIGDPDEGKKAIEAHAPPGDGTRLSDLPPPFHEVFRATEEAKKTIIFENVTVVVGRNSPDHYILCFSEEKSEGLAKEFESDTCIEIFNIRGFLGEITSTLASLKLIQTNLPGEFSCGFRHCTYGPRKVSWDQDTGEHAVFLKDTTYSSQKEYRAVWVPRSEVIKPVVISCLRLNKYCLEVPL